MPTPVRLEVWDRRAEKRLAIATTTGAAQRTWRLGGEERLSVSLDPADGAAAYLTRGAVLRLQREGDAADFSLWRVVSRKRTRSDDGGAHLEIAADALWMDARHGRVGQRQADGRTIQQFGLLGLTPLALMTDVILPAIAADALVFQAGVVELGAAVAAIDFDHTSPLAALRVVEAEAGGELQFRYSADGRTCYVDLLARVGTVAGGAEIRYRKNLAAIERLEDDTTLATRIHARGAEGLSLSDATWRVAANPSVGIFVLSPNPVFEDGALVNHYLQVPGGDNPHRILASEAATGRITCDKQGLAIGQMVRIATDVQGTYLSYLESPSAKAAYGVLLGEDFVAEDIPDATNLLVNGDLTGAYAGGLAPGWGTTGSVTLLAQTVDPRYALTGGKAQRVAAAADGGVLSAAAALTVGDARRPYHGFRVGLTVLSGQVRVELRHSNGRVYPIQLRPGTPGLNVYTDITAGPVHDEPLPAGTVQLAVLAHGGAADWVVDRAMVTAQVGGDVPAHVGTDGAQLLWALAAAELAAQAQPKREYQIDVVDLWGIDPATYPFERIGRGDSVKLRDPEFGAEDLRVVELVDDPLGEPPTPLRVSLARGAASRPPTREEDLYRTRSRGRRPQAAAGALLPERALVLSTSSAFDAADGRVYVTSVANTACATLELYTKATRAAGWPAAPAAVVAGRQGTFAGQLAAGGGVLFYRVVAKDGRGVAGGSLEDSHSRAEGSAPTLSPRVVLTADRDQANLPVSVFSREGERVRLAVRDGDAPASPVWRSVDGNGSLQPRWQASGTEFPENTWFTDGAGNWSSVLQNVPLARDQVVRRYLQGEGEQTALRSTWVPLSLGVREEASLESAVLNWDEAAGKLRGTVVGRAFVAGVRIDIDDDPGMSSPLVVDQGSFHALAPGQRLEVTASVPEGGRGREYHMRPTPYPGWSGITVSGPAGLAPRASTSVPYAASASLSLNAGEEVNGVTPLTLTYTPTDAAVVATINGSPVPLSGSTPGVRTYDLVRSEATDLRFLGHVSKPGFNPDSASYTVDRDPAPGLSSGVQTDNPRTATPTLRARMKDETDEIYLHLVNGGALIKAWKRQPGSNTSTTTHGTVEMVYTVPALATDEARGYFVSVAKAGEPAREVWRGVVTGPPPDTNTVTPLDPVVTLTRYEQGTNGDQEPVLLEAALGLYASGTLTYKHRPVRTGYPEEPWSTPVVYSGPVVIPLDKVPVQHTTLVVQVTDGTRTTTREYVAGIRTPYVDQATGLPTPSSPPYPGAPAGTTVSTVATDAGAGRAADTSLNDLASNSYYDRVGKRILRLRDSVTGQDVSGSTISDGARRGIAGLTTGGRVTVGVEPAADLAGLPTLLVSRQAHGVYFETFDALPTGWLVRGGSWIPADRVLEGVAGGWAKRCFGDTWVAAPVLIQYEPSKLYRIRFRVRCFNFGPGTFYLGIEGVSANKTTLANAYGLDSFGDQHHVAAYGASLPDSAGYTVFTGWFKGHGTPVLPANSAQSPSPLHPSVRYFRPLVYMPGGAFRDLDGIAIDVLDEVGAERVYKTLPAPGQLFPTVTVRESSVALNVARGVKVGECEDGASVSFNPAFERAPVVVFGSGGRTFRAGINGDQMITDRALNLTASGFTPSLKISGVAGSLTDRSAAFMGTDANKAEAAEAYDQTYRFSFAVTVNAGVATNPGDLTAPRAPSGVTVGFYTDNGSGWTPRGTRTYSNDGPAPETYGETVDVTVAGMGAGADFRITIDSVEGNGGSVTRSPVTWKEGAPPASESRTGGGASKVQYIAVAGS